MTSKPLGPLARFSPDPSKSKAIVERDEIFWAAHAKWREAESAMDAWAEHSDECLTAVNLLNRASELRDAMFLTPISTASALVMKFEALREGPGETDELLSTGLSIGEMMERDAQRIAMGETN